MTGVQTEKSARSILVYALLLFVVVVWGSSFVAARMLLSPTDPANPALSPTILATIRFVVASAIFLPVLIHRQFRSRRRLRLEDLPPFFLLGQLGISAYFWLQYTGVQLTNAGISAVLVVGTIPLATMLISHLALNETLGGVRALALALGTTGVVVVGSQRGLQIAGDAGFLFGALCLAGDAVAFAVYSATIRGLRERYDSLTITAGMMIGGTLGLTAISLITGGWSALGSLSAVQWGAIAYLAVVCSVLGYFFYNYALSRMAASRAAVWIYLEPPVAGALGWLLLGETIAFQTVIGAALIFVSLVLAHRT